LTDDANRPCGAEHALDDGGELGRDRHGTGATAIRPLGVLVPLERHPERRADLLGGTREDNLPLGRIGLDHLQPLFRGERPDGGDVGRVRAQGGAQVVPRQIGAFSDGLGRQGAGSRPRGREARSDPDRDLDALVRMDIADDLRSRYLLAAAAGNLDPPLLGWPVVFPFPGLPRTRLPVAADRPVGRSRVPGYFVQNAMWSENVPKTPP
jgi:hypothetical protein